MEEQEKGMSLLKPVWVNDRFPKFRQFAAVDTEDRDVTFVTKEELEVAYKIHADSAKVIKEALSSEPAFIVKMTLS